jgi:phosphinothricin acetyltransferase
MTWTLRPATPDDAPRIAEIYAVYVRETVISFELEPPAVDEMHRRLVAGMTRFPWLVAADEQDRVVGYAYAGEHRARAAYGWSVDVTIYLDRAAHRRGLGRRLYGALFEILRAQGFVTAFAGIALPNPASVGVHEAMGFERVGVYRNVGFKSGRWHDVGWWQRDLAEQPPPVPPAPIPLPDLPGAVLEQALRGR